MVVVGDWLVVDNARHEKHDFKNERQRHEHASKRNINMKNQKKNRRGKKIAESKIQKPKKGLVYADI